MTKRHFSLILNITPFDNDPPAGDTPAGDPPAGDPPAGDPSTGKVFSQEQVNAMMADQKKKIKAQNAEIVNTLQGQLNSFKGTAAEKSALQERIKVLKQEHMTAAERAAAKHSEAVTALQGELDSTKQHGDRGWKLYTEARSQTELLKAAQGGEAIVPSLVTDVLNPFTSLEETTDDEGKPTGNFEVVVSLPVTTEGVTKVQRLSAEEAIAAMKKMTDKYGPLFKSTAAGGIGGKNAGAGSGQLSDQEFYALATSDPAAYRREYARREGLQSSKK